MAEKKVIQGEDIIVLVDSKTTLHATTHNLKVDLELKELRTKDTHGKAYITSFSLGAPAGDNATYNYSLTGSGNLSPQDATSQQS